MLRATTIFVQLNRWASNRAIRTEFTAIFLFGT